MKNRLSLIFLPTDSFTGGNEMEGGFSVHLYRVGDNGLLEEREREYCRKNTGHYVFVNLPGGNYRIKAGGMYYTGEERELTLSEDVSYVDESTGEQVFPEEKITFAPSPCYPFPEGETYLVGQLVDSAGAAAPSATVEIEGDVRQSISDKRGKFVFCFSDLSGSADFTLNIAQEGYQPETSVVTVEEGKRNFETIELEQTPN